MPDITREEAYALITAGKPRIYGKDFNPDEENHELMVTCECRKSYIVEINAQSIIEDSGATIPQERVAFEKDDSIRCPHCGRSSKEWRFVNTHSGGIFNFTIMRAS